MTFLPKQLTGNENSELEWNKIPKPQYMYLSGSAFLVNLKFPNKQSLKVKSEFNSCDHAFNS